MEEKKDSYQFKSRVILGEARTPALVLWLVKKGFAKNQRSAGRMVILLAVVFFGLSIYLFSVVGSYAHLLSPLIR